MAINPSSAKMAINPKPRKVCSRKIMVTSPFVMDMFHALSIKCLHEATMNSAFGLMLGWKQDGES
jgi:hypothetical protein